MTFPVEIVLKGQEAAVTEDLSIPHGEPSTWNDAAVRDALVEIIRAIDRAQNPSSPRDRAVMLQGFSWIVEPVGNQVVIALEIPMGAAVAGPFTANQAELDAMITRVLRNERKIVTPTTIH